MYTSTLRTMFAVSLACVAAVAGAGGNPAPVVVKQGLQRVGDILMGYKTFGSGSPLVLIMGYGSTMELWEPAFIASLARNHTVIIFDNRGLGKSEAGSQDFSIRQFSEDTAGLMTALGVQHASVLGWSMGSLIAQELSLRHPEMVDHLILYAGFSDPAMFPASNEVLAMLSDSSGTPEERGNRYMTSLFTMEWMRSNGARIREIFYRPLGDISGENVGRQSAAIGSWEGTTSRLGSITAPTLVIAGTQDVLARQENSIFLASMIPGARLVLVEGTGHGLMFQDRDRFLSEVAAFLDAH